MDDVLRRLGLWTILCSLSAAPSFVLGAMTNHNVAAMGVGVAVFIGLYTLGTSTAKFHRFSRRPFVRRTLYIGYGTRLIISAGAFVMPLDMIPGIFSVGFVQNVMGIQAETFAGTLLITIVQGTLLNLIISLFMLLLYAAQRMFCTPPADQQPRGFEVISSAAPVAAQPVQPLTASPPAP